MKLFGLILLSLIQIGCFGTMATRNTDGQIIGSYPYKAMTEDGKFLAETISRPLDHGGKITVPLAIISFPIDLIFDTILIIPDVIAWPFGLKKSNILSGSEFPRIPAESSNESLHRTAK